MWQEKAMGLSIFATAVAVTLVLVLPAISTQDTDVPLAGPIETYADKSSAELSGEFLTLQDFEDLDAPAAIHGNWFTEPVVVLKLHTDLLDAGTDAMPLPGDADHSLVGYSAKSTHLGCTVSLYGVGNEVRTDSEWDKDGDQLSDGVLLDPCHQGSWDPYQRGRHMNGWGDGPLWPLELSVRADGTLIGSARI